MADSNLAPTAVGQQETWLDQLFGGAIGKGGGGPIAQQLFSLGQGILPQSMQDMITATTNEQFGGMGARFGTDLATATSRGLGQAGAMQSLQAIHEILGLGGTTTGFEFKRSEDAMDRALQEWQTSQQFDSQDGLLKALLGIG